MNIQTQATWRANRVRIIVGFCERSMGNGVMALTGSQAGRPELKQL